MYLGRETVPVLFSPWVLFFFPLCRSLRVKRFLIPVLPCLGVQYFVCLLVLSFHAFLITLLPRRRA